MTKAETQALAEAIADLLHDADAGLSVTARHRWEGALAALDAVLGRVTSLPVDHPEDFLL